jgi:general secretion pathway protein A
LLEEVRLLANIETGPDRRLSVILAGQPELAGRLNDPSLRQFKQRIALRCELNALTRQETARYISGRIAAAGGVGSEIFSREAVNEIYERSGGIPRSISVIADNALLGGFAAASKPVSRKIVKEVCADLHLESPSAASAIAMPSPSPDVPAGGGRAQAAKSNAGAGPRSMFNGFVKSRRSLFGW